MSSVKTGTCVFPAVSPAPGQGELVPSGCSAGDSARGGPGVCKHVSCVSPSLCGALCVCAFRRVGATGPRGGGQGVGCLPLGSRGRGRCQEGAAGSPVGGSRRSTHTGGPDPPGPGTGSSRGCPRRSCRPPLRETRRRPSSAGPCSLRVRAPRSSSYLLQPPVPPQGAANHKHSAATAPSTVILTGILSSGGCLSAPVDR